MKTPDNIEPETNPENTESAAGAGCPASPYSAERLYDVIYQTPSGEIHEFRMVSDFDALRQQEIKNDPEKRKGSWFASNRPKISKSYFRI